MVDVDPPLMAHLRDCNVRYEGRGRTSQSGVDLAVVVKENGAVVAHTLNANVRPQFYNPGGELSVWERLDRLYIRSESDQGEELRINGVPEVLRELEAHSSNERPDRYYTAGIEDDIADLITAQPSLIGKPGTEPHREVKRMGGRVDLEFADGTVVEVKRRADVTTYDQASRYLRDPDIRQVIIACLSASENLSEVSGRDEDIELALLDDEELDAHLSE